MTGRPDLTAEAELQALRSELGALRERERRMALALEGSGTGVWDRDIPANQIHYSRAWKAMLGYADHEISNQLSESYKRVHPDDLAYVQATMKAHADGTTEVYEVEHRLRCKDGSYKWVHSRGKVMERDADGNALRMVGTTTDITALRGLSETLQQTVDLLTFLTDEVPGLVFCYQDDADGRGFFTYVSAGVRDIYEVEPQQALRDPAAIQRVIHPEDIPRYRESRARSASTLAPWRLDFRVLLPRQGLGWRQLDARPQRLEDGTMVWRGFITDVTERKRIEAELQLSATTDDLTQLPNRRYFMDQLGAELARMRRDGDGSAAVLMCDLDYFKTINDQWGHAIGDLGLQHFAAMLRQQLRATDVAGRMGGEEFAVLLRRCGAEAAMNFARRLQRALAASPLLVGDQKVVLTVSVGIANLHASDDDASLALNRSDEALYRAKKGGRNRVECHQ